MSEQEQKQVAMEEQQPVETAESETLEIESEPSEEAAAESGAATSPQSTAETVQRRRGQRRKLTGVVVSDKMDKTIVVMVERRTAHPLYKKYYTRRKKFLAHDEHNECRVGDVVQIMETRPLSRRKRWRLVAILERGKQRGRK